MPSDSDRQCTVTRKPANGRFYGQTKAGLSRPLCLIHSHEGLQLSEFSHPWSVLNSDMKGSILRNCYFKQFEEYLGPEVSCSPKTVN
jgi:hypothetical protein